MSNRFSAALQITDLDDFITPSQECIKPVQIEKVSSSVTGAKIKIHKDGYYEEDLSGNVQQLKKVNITLNDCLACSGCITSAEEVLINHQNFTEMLNNFTKLEELKQNGHSKLVVVSLSIQPVLSLAANYKMTPEHTAECLASLFKNLGADMVLEMSLAEDIALLELQHEFIQRYTNSKENKQMIPMLGSSCPGWICYAEKTHGSFILPYISTTKSPQQIMGSLVKYNLQVSPENVYHVTLMPCYDKKLEASRNEFFNLEINARDVDCVITTVEIEQLLLEKNIKFCDLPRTALDYPWGSLHTNEIFGHEGSGSGGYAHHILIHAAEKLLGVQMTDMNWKAVRNPDFLEIIVENDSNEILRFAIANGFRNIQNVVQKIKKGKSSYHFIEIMACPSGCLNGGAQIKPEDNLHIKDHIAALEDLYKNLPRVSPEKNIIAQKLYQEWLGGYESDKCQALFHTTYHQVEKTQTALNIKW